MSYLFSISTENIQRNVFSRLSSDIVRLICSHLCSVADIVAFARTCKFNYVAIAPLFVIRVTGENQWNGLCISLIGNVAPIKLLRIIGGSVYYVDNDSKVITADHDWYFQHVNILKRALEPPYDALYQRCIKHGGDTYWAKVLLQLQPDDAKYILLELRKIIGLSNGHFFRRQRKRLKLTE